MARVLIVEDDKSMNDILVATLTDVELEVRSAFHGKEALEICRDESFELLVTDVRLPGMDGVELIEKLKPAETGMKCIVITGYADFDTPARAIRLNVDDYLIKPFSLRYFLGSVQRVLNQEAEKSTKRALFSQLFERFGLSLGNATDSKFEGMVRKREQAFRSFYVGIRSGCLKQASGAVLYSSLESLEGRFRSLMNDRTTEETKIDRLGNSYRKIQNRLASLEIGEEEDEGTQGTLPLTSFAPLFRAIKESEISFGDLLYAPLLRKTPDSRLEPLIEILELKRKLWPGLAS